MRLAKRGRAQKLEVRTNTNRNSLKPFVVGLPRCTPFCARSIDAAAKDEAADVASVRRPPRKAKAVFVDMAGNRAVLESVHYIFGEGLMHSCVVGATHQGKGGRPPKGLPGAKPKFFFAPSWIARRLKEWKATSVGGLLQKLAPDFHAFVRDCEWLNVAKAVGPDECLSAYARVAEGRQPPNTGVSMSMGTGGARL